MTFSRSTYGKKYKRIHYYYRVPLRKMNCKCDRKFRIRLFHFIIYELPDLERTIRQNKLVDNFMLLLLTYRHL